MDQSFLSKIFNAHQQCPECPSEDEVSSFFQDLLGTLFPVYSRRNYESVDQLEQHLCELQQQLFDMLNIKQNHEGVNAEENSRLFFEAVPEIYEKLNQDVKAVFDGDPAARSESEVIRTYPGFYAIASYRFGHFLYNKGVQIIPRMITEQAHARTGIDIHPGAKIGKNFCIDHGTGIVIGETTDIGDNVKLYQGVTLGALSVNKEDASKKRHPTIEDNVVIYANATILGGETVVGHDSIVGGNVWITRSVPAFTQVIYQNKRQVEDTENSDTIRLKTIVK
ncbi:MAG: serine acetyltransferase [Cyclobacteriaceae bacterium]